jgi:hypothetical protein
MPIIPKEPDDSASENKAPYRASLVNRSHQILKMGYDRLDSGSLVASEEEVITGRLTQAMQDSLEDMKAPLWTKNFSAHEEKRVNDGERDGKRRLRIDIEVIEHLRGPRPRFRFEAKRLRDTDSRREYLGHDGLGCFLDGRYAASDPDAGMLGYVQEGKAVEHVAAIAEYLRKDPARFGVAQASGWKEHRLVKGLQTFASSHQRTGGLRDILVFHTLLDFQ